MDLADRIERYKAIEAYRKRPLIVYATSTRAGISAQMASDAVRGFIDQLDTIDGDKVDVLLHSTGGDALAAWKLMSLLRERFKTVGVLVPYMAFSAATIFALGADEIVLHPNASLGPIDPQITMRTSDGGSRQFSFEDVGAFLRFLREEIRITEQSFLSPAVEQLFRVVDPVHLGGAKRASELSTDVGERLLQMHMTDEEAKSQARLIAESLNKTFFAHGDAVSRKRARALSLKVRDDDPGLEKLLWDAFLGLESHMELRSPFKPLEVFLAGAGANALPPPVTVNLPMNMPQNVANSIWQQVGQAAVTSAMQGTEVDYTCVSAVIESVRIASEFAITMGISAQRMGGGEVKVMVTDKAGAWRPLSMPALTADESASNKRAKKTEAGDGKSN